MNEPDSFEGRHLRVEGELRQGSIQFREEPCEWRFVLHKEDKEMPVRFPQCVVPDTFRDGMGIQVTVQGELGGDGRLPRKPGDSTLPLEVRDAGADGSRRGNAPTTRTRRFRVRASQS